MEIGCSSGYKISNSLFDNLSVDVQINHLGRILSAFNLHLDPYRSFPYPNTLKESQSLLGTQFRASKLM